MRKTIFRLISRSWTLDAIILLIAGAVVYGFISLEWSLSALANPLLSLFDTSAKQLIQLFDESLQFANETITPLLFLKIFAAIVILYLLLWRLIWRMRTFDKLTSTECPKCGYPLSRIKRTPLQRVASRLIPIRRFHCKKCRWTGARLKPYKPIPLDIQEGAYRAYSQSEKIDTSA